MKWNEIEIEMLSWQVSDRVDRFVLKLIIAMNCRTILLQIEGRKKTFRDKIMFNKYKMPEIEYRGIKLLFLT